ncbi:hypothetical protein UCRPC4_g00723 [Phaeomoniella chlamydospora]|uniref:Uncharacterized protein n=1 Tax=Phaeomoniella chlamydospora TaxID=158046 RepID=A0A0G2GXU2_PHACM|nr:hypothetical protein UCRPC4_g00723 [Phaeomoniella chlamydospora]
MSQQLQITQSEAVGQGSKKRNDEIVLEHNDSTDSLATISQYPEYDVFDDDVAVGQEPSGQLEVIQTEKSAAGLHTGKQFSENFSQPSQHSITGIFRGQASSGTNEQSTKITEKQELLSKHDQSSYIASNTPKAGSSNVINHKEIKANGKETQQRNIDVGKELHEQSHQAGLTKRGEVKVEDAEKQCCHHKPEVGGCEEQVAEQTNKPHKEQGPSKDIKSPYLDHIEDTTSHLEKDAVRKGENEVTDHGHTHSNTITTLEDQAGDQNIRQDLVNLLEQIEEFINDAEYRRHCRTSSDTSEEQTVGRQDVEQDELGPSKLGEIGELGTAHTHETNSQSELSPSFFSSLSCSSSTPVAERASPSGPVAVAARSASSGSFVAQRIAEIELQERQRAERRRAQSEQSTPEKGDGIGPLLSDSQHSIAIKEQGLEIKPTTLEDEQQEVLPTERGQSAQSEHLASESGDNIQPRETNKPESLSEQERGLIATTKG